MIEMMNTKLKVGNVPNLRFPGFVGEWEVKRLKDLGSFYSGGTPKTTHKDYYDGNIPFIRSGEIHFDITELHISEIGLKNSSAKMVNRGQILIALYGATSGEISISKIEGAINQAILCFETKINRQFFKNLWQKHIDKTLKSYLQGGQGNLSAEIIKQLEFKFPANDEQTKIADFIAKIEEHIQTQNKIISDLKLLKNTLSKKIFSQQLKFLDADGKSFPVWEIKKVSEIFKITRGNVLSMNLVISKQSNNAHYPVYSSQTKNKGLAGYYNEFLFENAITWTTDGANAGDVNYRSGKFYCTNVCGVLLNQEGYANICIADLINSVSKNYVSYVGNPKLMNGIMGEIKIPFPSLNEQKKISKLFGIFEIKIDIEFQLLERLKEQKSYLLANLFI